MKDSHGVVIVFNADIPSHLKEIEMWYSCFVQQQFLQNTQCLLIAHHKPGSGSDKENPALGKEPGILAFVWNALGICMLLCVLEVNSSGQFVSTYCVLAICLPHHVNQNCRVSRSTIPPRPGCRRCKSRQTLRGGKNLVLTPHPYYWGHSFLTCL